MDTRVGRAVQRSVGRSLQAAQRVVHDVGGAWVEAAVAAVPAPVVPVTEDWHVSLAGLAERHAHVPGVAARRLRALDRFGAVHLGPDEVGLDDDVVAWDRVLRLRTQVGWAVVSGDALERSLDTAAATLPRVPGRRWLLDRIGEATVSLFAVAAAGDVADALDAARADDADAVLATRRVVSAIEYRGRRRVRTIEVSPASALLQLAFPTAVEGLLDVAAHRALDVVHESLDDHETAVLLARGLRWRERADDLAERLRARRQPV